MSLFLSLIFFLAGIGHNKPLKVTEEFIVVHGGSGAIKTNLSDFVFSLGIGRRVKH